MKNIYNFFYFFSIEQQRDDEKTNDKEINGKETYNDDTQTQRRMVRSRRNKGITARATARQTRRRVIFFFFLYLYVYVYTCILFIFPALKFLIIIEIRFSIFSLFSK